MKRFENESVTKMADAPKRKNMKFSTRNLQALHTECLQSDSIVKFSKSDSIKHCITGWHSVHSQEVLRHLPMAENAFFELSLNLVDIFSP